MYLDELLTTWKDTFSYGFQQANWRQLVRYVHPTDRLLDDSWSIRAKISRAKISRTKIGEVIRLVIRYESP